MAPFVLLLDWDGFEKDKYVHTVLEDNLLPNYLEKCSWFSAITRRSWRIKITSATRMEVGKDTFFFTFLQVKCSSGKVANYLFPLSFIENGESPIEEKSIITKAILDEKEGYLVEALYDPKFRAGIFYNIKNQISTPQKNKKILTFNKGETLEDDEITQNETLEIEGNNSAFVINGKYFFKLYRKIFNGHNPESDFLNYLSNSDKFNNYPKYYGSINLNDAVNESFTFGILLENVQNPKSSWDETYNWLSNFVEGLQDGYFKVKESDFITVAQLGKHTACMHDALYDLAGEAPFRAETIDRAYRRQTHRDLEDQLDKVYDLLTENYLDLDEYTQSLAWQFMEAKEKITNYVDQILTRQLKAVRIRVHGDYHLNQVLNNDNGTYIIDFEGDAEMPISKRIVKHSPLKDVASMIRSYHYVISKKLYDNKEAINGSDKEIARAASRWYHLMKDTFLEQYLQYFGTHHTLLSNNNEVNYLLQFHLLEKTIQELHYEIKKRPTWAHIPLKGILDVIRELEKFRNV